MHSHMHPTFKTTLLQYISKWLTSNNTNNDTLKGKGKKNRQYSLGLKGRERERVEGLRTLEKSRSCLIYNNRSLKWSFFFSPTNRQQSTVMRWHISNKAEESTLFPLQSLGYRLAGHWRVSIYFICALLYI